jgi:hypothetical protein
MASATIDPSGTSNTPGDITHPPTWTLISAAADVEAVDC